MEPLVKLVSFLAKALYRDQILVSLGVWNSPGEYMLTEQQPIVVSTCLKTVVQTALAKWGIAGSITGKENSNPDISKGTTDKKAAFDLICSSLDKIKELDKKKWHHKVYFRVTFTCIGLTI